jgi:hypothetical protein
MSREGSSAVAFKKAPVETIISQLMSYGLKVVIQK